MGTAAQQGLYARPALYDILYTPGTAAEVDALQRIEAFCSGKTGDRLRSERLWFEPACGTGRYLRTAANRGLRTAGFDLDPGQIDYARRSRALRSTRLFCADMADFLDAAYATDLVQGTVDFAFNPVNSIRHLASDQLVWAHLRQIARILRPGAVYVVGLSLTDYRSLEAEEDLWEGRRGRCRVSQLVNYLPPEPGTERARQERVISHLTVHRPRGVEHFDDVYDLRCYDDRQWRTIVSKADLESAGSFDATGEPLGDRRLPYQLEALRSAG